jgi:50S ribosomal protein L16 3-hydroxylase
MTYSIGFRAPAPLDLADGFVSHLAESFDPRDRYADPGLPLQEHPGEITPEALARIRATLRGLLADDDALDRWFGRFVTEPRRGLYGELPDEPYEPGDLAGLLADGAALHRSALADFAFIRHPDGTATLFAAGQAYPLEGPLAYAAPLLTGPGRLGRTTLAPHLSDTAFLDLLTALLNEGALRPENSE